MGENSNIGWTDATHNEWIGCTEIGADGACVFCYARELDKRYQFGVPPPERTPEIAPHWGDDKPRHRTSEANRRKPLIWNRRAHANGVPEKVFCNSLSDVFDNKVDQQWREDLYATWRATPWLRWIVLTKRVPNIKKMLPADWGDGYPNVGLMATVVTQTEYERDAPRLLDVPARWHGFSMEPQLGPITLRAELTIGRGSIWCITGGESRQRGVLDADGHERQTRPYDIKWINGLLAFKEQAGNLFVFVKQTGERPVGMDAPRDGMGKDQSAWPEWMRVQEFPPELLR